MTTRLQAYRPQDFGKSTKPRRGMCSANRCLRTPVVVLVVPVGYHYGEATRRDAYCEIHVLNRLQDELINEMASRLNLKHKTVKRIQSALGRM